jgi:hypothetical protein
VKPPSDTLLRNKNNVIFVNKYFQCLQGSIGNVFKPLSGYLKELVDKIKPFDHSPGELFNRPFDLGTKELDTPYEKNFPGLYRSSDERDAMIKLGPSS